MLPRPVLSSGSTHDQSHIEILSPNICVYNDYDNLKNIMLGMSHNVMLINSVMKADFAVHYKAYGPFNIMADFNRKFLNSKLTQRQAIADMGQQLDLEKLTRTASALCPSSIKGDDGRPAYDSVKPHQMHT